MTSALELTDALRAEGYRITPQRQRIFAALEDLHDAHPTAEAIYAHVVVDRPTISLRTVYQTLNDLVAVGALAPVDLGTGSTRFDPVVDAHHHLVCDDCGEVVDVHADFDEVSLPPAVRGRFEISATEITFRGRCGACRTGS